MVSRQLATNKACADKSRRSHIILIITTLQSGWFAHMRVDEVTHWFIYYFPVYLSDVCGTHCVCCCVIAKRHIDDRDCGAQFDDARRALAGGDNFTTTCTRFKNIYALRYPKGVAHHQNCNHNNNNLRHAGQCLFMRHILTCIGSRWLLCCAFMIWIKQSARLTLIFLD